MKILDIAPVEIPGDDMSVCWAALDDMSSAVEAKSSLASGQVLLPELFAATPEMIGKR